MAKRKHIQLPEPIEKEANKLVKDTGFDFNTLNTVAWIKMLFTRGKKPNRNSIEKYIDYLKNLK